MTAEVGFWEGVILPYRLEIDCRGANSLASVRQQLDALEWMKEEALARGLTFLQWDEEGGTKQFIEIRA